MTEIEFIDYWNKEYPKTIPINHQLKLIYQDRWFRIHSLPESKRYAETKSELFIGNENDLIMMS
jgi:hypothetical protein